MFTNSPLGGQEAVTSVESILMPHRRSSEPLPKKIFDYDVIDRIGEGARSYIYAVSHPKTKQLYALKHVKRATEKDDRFIEQVITEYEVGQKVQHKNIRKLLELKTSRNMLLKITEIGLVMELFDGHPLEENLPRSLTKLIQIFIETAKAIEAMHAAGFVHCDLKPINILLSSHGQVKVIDLGQAAPIGTEKTRIQGTPDYIAPEQVKCRPVTMRTDIYNLGATMYWALTGKKIPTLYTVRKAAKGHGPSFLLDDQVAAPRELIPTVPELLSVLVMECVRSDPRKRPGDMTEVIRRLETIQHTIQRDKKSGSVA
jgi:eukaryotic-like serine/threonine-protein kinase